MDNEISAGDPSSVRRKATELLQHGINNATNLESKEKTRNGTKKPLQSSKSKYKMNQQKGEIAGAALQDAVNADHIVPKPTTREVDVPEQLPVPVQEPINEGSSSPGPVLKPANSLGDVQSVSGDGHQYSWPHHICSFRSRKHLTYDENSKTVTYDGSIKDVCFVCERGGEELTSCQGFIEGMLAAKKRKCKTMFHMKCLQNYNAGDYCLQYIMSPECQNEILCPLHSCSYCYTNRRRQTAFEGLLMECLYCYRSFHVDCDPSGCSIMEVSVKDDTQTFKAVMVGCPSHANLPMIKGKHLGICCECERDDGNLTNCDRCLRSFHEKCKTLKTLDGKPVPENTCEPCLHQETFTKGRSAIAYYHDRKMFYACKVADRDCYPLKDSKVNKIGYVVVKWEGHKLYSLAPVNTVMLLFQSSFELKALKQTKLPAIDLNAWQESVESLEDPIYPQPYKEVRKEVQTSLYYKKKNPFAQFTFEEKFHCECPENGKNRCGPNTKCSNRAMKYECPESCEQKGGCGNRNVSTKKLCPLLERWQTENRGYGVRATGDIPKGAFIAEYAGEIIDLKEKKLRMDLNKKGRDNEAQLYMMAIDSTRTVDAARCGNISRYINHSCDPNCGVDKIKIIVQKKEDDIEVKYDERVYLYAMKAIAKGEELTFSYNMDHKDVSAPDCLCQSENCSGRLGAKKDVPKESVSGPVVLAGARAQKRATTTSKNIFVRSPSPLRPPAKKFLATLPTAAKGKSKDQQKGGKKADAVVILEVPSAADFEAYKRVREFVLAQKENEAPGTGPFCICHDRLFIDGQDTPEAIVAWPAKAQKNLQKAPALAAPLQQKPSAQKIPKVVQRAVRGAQAQENEQPPIKVPLLAEESQNTRSRRQFRF